MSDQTPSRARRLLRWTGRKLGLVTWYHVTATYPVSGGKAALSLTCSVRPWLHHDNFLDLVEYVDSQAGTEKGGKPNIVSLTRLGL